MSVNTIARALTGLIILGFIGAGMLDVLQYRVVQVFLLVLTLVLVYLLVNVSLSLRKKKSRN